MWTLSQQAEGPRADVLSPAVPWNHGPTWFGGRGGTLHVHRLLQPMQREAQRWELGN